MKVFAWESDAGVLTEPAASATVALPLAVDL